MHVFVLVIVTVLVSGPANATPDAPCSTSADCTAADPCSPELCDTEITHRCFVSPSLLDEVTNLCPSGSGFCDEGACKPGLGQPCAGPDDCFDELTCGGSAGAQTCMPTVLDPVPCVGNANCPSFDTCLPASCDLGTGFCRSGTPLADGATCTLALGPFGMPGGQCGRDRLGHDHACLLPVGQPCATGRECQSGTCQLSLEGKQLCSSVPTCAPCRVADAAGASCVLAPAGTACGETNCDRGRSLAHTCDGAGACVTSASPCAGGPDAGQDASDVGVGSPDAAGPVAGGGGCGCQAGGAARPGWPLALLALSILLSRRSR